MPDTMLHTGAADPATSDTAAKRLRSFIERIERLKEEIHGINADVSEIYKEAKGIGLNASAMKEIVKIRAKDPEKRRELEEDIDLYKQALGMLG